MDVNYSDKEFLEYSCKCAEVIFNNIEGEVAFIKDADFNMCYLSEKYQAEYRKDSYVTIDPEQDESEAQKIITQKALEQDQNIKKTLQGSSYLFVDVYDRIGIIRKRPIVNPSTNNFVGILGVTKSFHLPNILELINKMNNIPDKNPVDTTPFKYELTEKQNMVLFLYLNRFSSSDISEILTSLGHKTSRARVNDHLENLKFIFHAKNKEELIEKGIAFKYHLLIPRKFLKIGAHEFEEELIISGNELTLKNT